MPSNPILMGVVGRPHGVRGLVHVQSYTADPAALSGYGPLFDDRGRHFRLRWQSEGVARLAEIRDGTEYPLADRSAAEALTNLRLYVERDRLPPAEEDEFYLVDLIGLAVEDTAGAALGKVTVVHDYGAGVSLEIARPDAPVLLLPFTAKVVPVVDIAGRRIVADPPAVLSVEPPADEPAGAQPSEARA